MPGPGSFQRLPAITRYAPKIPSRDGPVGRPRFRYLAQLFGLWLFGKRFQSAVALANTEIVDRQNVHTFQGVHQQHLDGPTADAFDGDHSLDESVVVDR